MRALLVLALIATAAYATSTSD